eukprot:jgi/Mesvir1/9833/Mv14236-RA.1
MSKDTSQARSGLTTGLLSIDERNVQAPDGSPNESAALVQEDDGEGSFAWTVFGVVTVAASIVAAGVLIALFSSSVVPSTIDYDRWHRTFLALPDNDSCARTLKALTTRPHLAGSDGNLDVLNYMQDRLQEWGYTVNAVVYNVLLSYPLHRSVTVQPDDGDPIELGLTEEVIDGDRYSGNKNIPPSFHGYSPSGNITAQVIYVNYGQTEDFELLRQQGVELKGYLALVRYGKIFRGDKVRNAAAEGMVGCLVFSDDVSEGRGRYPNGPYAPLTGIQRGTVYEGIGDPLTPGWPSVPGAEHVPINSSQAQLPTIPSLPISYTDARVILTQLLGIEVPTTWLPGDMRSQSVGPGNFSVNLVVEMNNTVVPIQNLFAQIVGEEEPDRYVLVGNHRDAWTFGAVDPNSGTAVMMEMARALGSMMAHGWRPRRSIIFCSWDAEEYGLIGSTEWVEDNALELKSRAVAYLNLDAAVSGPRLQISATPSLDHLIHEMAKLVKDPLAAPGSQDTMYDRWVKSSHDSKSIQSGGDVGVDVAFDALPETKEEAVPVNVTKARAEMAGAPVGSTEGSSVGQESSAGAGVTSPLRSQPAKVGRLGGHGSDYASFQQHVGIPSADASCSFEQETASLYPVYHMAYDNYHWMEMYGDPLFLNHAAMASLWGLVALRLTDDQLLPFNYSHYADELTVYTSAIDKQLSKAAVRRHLANTDAIWASINELTAADVLAGTEADEVAVGYLDLQFWHPTLGSGDSSSNPSGLASSLNNAGGGGNSRGLLLPRRGLDGRVQDGTRYPSSSSSSYSSSSYSSSYDPSGSTPAPKAEIRPSGTTNPHGQPMTSVWWARRRLNDRMMMAERGFLDDEGLVGRPWFKHLVYAPSGENQYLTEGFPGIAAALQVALDWNKPGGYVSSKGPDSTSAWRAVQHEIHRVARSIGRAAKVLRGKPMFE